jgi:hypothetical protein
VIESAGTTNLTAMSFRPFADEEDIREAVTLNLFFGAFSQENQPESLRIWSNPDPPL